MFYGKAKKSGSEDSGRITKAHLTAAKRRGIKLPKKGIKYVKRGI